MRGGSGSTTCSPTRTHACRERALEAFVKQLVAWSDQASKAPADEPFEAFDRRLRHDLRTPLNAIKGYSEMLIEDMEDDDEHPLLADLAKLKRSADQLLDQIDSMVALARQRCRAERRSAHPAYRCRGGCPAHRPAARTSASAPRKQMPSSRILVVDDNAANRDVLARRLTREGHRS